MATEQLLEKVNEAMRTQLKKAMEDLAAAHTNQRILIELLSDTMKALEAERKKNGTKAHDPWKSTAWKNLLCRLQPCDESALTVEETTTGLEEVDLYS